MNWLLFCDEQDFSEKINNFLTTKDKKNKLFTTDFNIKNILKTHDEMMLSACCLIFCTKDLDFDEKLDLSRIAGFMESHEVPIVTNIEFLGKSAITKLTKTKYFKTQSTLFDFFTENYESFIENSKKRISKTRLLNKGIPFTPDCMASYIAKNKSKIFNEFISAGMSVNERDDEGTPLLNIACRNDNFELAKKIIAEGADINSTSLDRGYTPVMDAVWRGNEKITAFLISKGADLNTINKEGQTNLILAVGADRTKIVKLLAENGANPDIKDHMGMSAWNYANLFRKTKILEILKPYHKES